MRVKKIFEINKIMTNE
jgi:hypothetical protein